jgi:hypothetical protein
MKRKSERIPLNINFYVMLYPRPQALPESGPLELLLRQALTLVMPKTEAVTVNLTNLGKYSLDPW